MRLQKEYTAGLAALLFCAFPTTAQPVFGPPQIPMIPLEVGATWEYEGSVAWPSQAGVPGSAVESRPVSLKVQVTEVIDRGYITAATVVGHPKDLEFFSGLPRRGEYMFVRVGTRRYYLIEQPRVGEILARLRNPSDVLTDLIADEELFLDGPLVAGERVCPAKQMTWDCPTCSAIVPSCWLVTKAPEAVTDDQWQSTADSYDLAWRSASGLTTMRIAPGVGITRYVYADAQARRAVDVRLVNVQPLPSQ